MALVNRRVMRLQLALAHARAGRRSMPPLAPPNGTSTSAVFHVISDASARTSSRSADGW